MAIANFSCHSRPQVKSEDIAFLRSHNMRDKVVRDIRINCLYLLQLTTYYCQTDANFPSMYADVTDFNNAVLEDTLVSHTAFITAFLEQLAR